VQPSALFLVLALAGCTEAGPVAIVHPTDGSPITVQLEVVSTPAGRERGLMYRTSLAEDHGMLFVFDDDADRSFWMKNTLIPLDMLFLSRDGRVVGIHPDAVPLSTTPLSVGQPSALVLEVNGGWARRHGVRTGDRVELRGVATSP
jgi:hypothetical protein